MNRFSSVSSTLRKTARSANALSGKKKSRHRWKRAVRLEDAKVIALLIERRLEVSLLRLIQLLKEAALNPLVVEHDAERLGCGGDVEDIGDRLVAARGCGGRRGPACEAADSRCDRRRARKIERPFCVCAAVQKRLKWLKRPGDTRCGRLHEAEIIRWRRRALRQLAANHTMFRLDAEETV
jgi:hypothetical protein